VYARTLSRAKTIICSSTKHSLEGTQNQYERLDEAIRPGRFVRNSIIRAWMDGQVKSRNDAYTYCQILADNPEFPWARLLNSQA
jgi:putative transposase